MRKIINDLKWQDYVLIAMAILVVVTCFHVLRLKVNCDTCVEKGFCWRSYTHLLDNSSVMNTSNDSLNLSDIFTDQQLKRIEWEEGKS